MVAGIDDLAIAGIGAGTNLLSNSMGAQAQAEVARRQQQNALRQLQEQQKEFAARQQFAEQRRDLGGSVAGQGEQQFLNTYSGAPQELEDLKTQIAQQGTLGQQQAAKQSLANMSLQGISGPQAGIIAAEQAGKLGRSLTGDVSQMALNEALQRRSAVGSYFGNKAAQGYGAQLAPGGF